MEWSSSARAARVSSSTSSRPSGPSQSPNKQAGLVSMLSKDTDYEVRELNAWVPVCHLSGTSTLCLHLHFVDSTTAKRPTECSERRGHKQKRLGSKVTCTDSLPHKAHEGQRVYSAPVCTHGTERLRQKAWNFLRRSCSREERGGRLREYRLKRVDTHWLSAIPFRVNMTHRYRPLGSTEGGEMSDVI